MLSSKGFEGANFALENLYAGSTAAFFKRFAMSAALVGELAALGAAISWAVAPILYRRALFKTSPIQANIVRCVSNAAVMLLILVALGKVGALASLPADVVAVTVVSGVVGLGIGDTLYLIGLKSVGVARAVPLSASYPLFSLVWATFLLHEPLTATAVLGAAVILVGIWLLSREKNEDTSTPNVNRRLMTLGVAASLVTAVVWSVSVTLMDVAVSMPGVNSLDANYAVITARIASMALFFLLLVPVLDKGRGFLKMKRSTLIELCAGGLVANGIGWLLMNFSFLNLVEAQAVPISSTTPLFSAIAGFALFHEKITKNNILGAALIVVGIFLLFIV